jgi:four helix bundle protein
MHFSSDPLRHKSFHLAIRIIRLTNHLQQEKKEWLISRQIARSGTNPGAMIREATNAESGLDFIHKLAVAQKETAETLYWLDLLCELELITETEYHSLHNDAGEIMKMLRSSILTKKEKLKKQRTQHLLTLLVFISTIAAIFWH